MRDLLGPITINGARYFPMERAAELVDAVTPVTLARWCVKGITPFGMTLRIVRTPYPKHSAIPSRRPREFRIMLHEGDVKTLNTLLHDFPIRPGPISRKALEDLQRASRLHPTLEP